MTEPISGSARQMEMTLPGYTVAELLVASIVGKPTGDPFWDALQEVALKGAARLGEMGETGFDTSDRFDHKLLTARVGKPLLFPVDSLGKTGTTYEVAVAQRVGETYHVGVRVAHTPMRPGVKLRRMTLVCAENGTMRFTPGW